MEKTRHFLFTVLLMSSCLLFADPDRPGFFDQVSEPSRLFSVPTASIMKSMEVTLSGGGLVSVEGNKAMIQKFNVGLGGIAEVEFATSGIRNSLTGTSERMPTSIFKVALIPERFQHHWFIPDVAVQLRSTSWNVLDGSHDNLKTATTEAYAGRNLVAIDNLQKRFSVLYLIVGKRFEFGGLHIGISQTDVRTRQGYRYYYDSMLDSHLSERIPEMDTQFVTPFGGIEIVANANTRLMAEIQAIPAFDYDPKQEKVEVNQLWLGIAGIRFLLTNWLSLDTGVRYQNDYRGIADAEIDIGINCVLPVASLKHRR